MLLVPEGQRQRPGDDWKDGRRMEEQDRVIFSFRLGCKNWVCGESSWHLFTRRIVFLKRSVDLSCLRGRDRDKVEGFWNQSRRLGLNRGFDGFCSPDTGTKSEILSWGNGSSWGGRGEVASGKNWSHSSHTSLTISKWQSVAQNREEDYYPTLPFHDSKSLPLPPSTPTMNPSVALAKAA